VRAANPLFLPAWSVPAVMAPLARRARGLLRRGRQWCKPDAPLQLGARWPTAAGTPRNQARRRARSGGM